MPISARAAQLLPVGLRALCVGRIADLAPAMRRITLTGEQLGRCADGAGGMTGAFTSPTFDDDVRLLFPYPGDNAPVLPVIRDGRVTFAEGRRPIARAYTVRRFDPDALEVDIDIVLHGSGIASDWARAARVGDTMHIAGPGKTLPLPAGLDHCLVLGDETALPAIARLLEELPAGCVGEVRISGDERRVGHALSAPDGVSVHWAPPGAYGAPAGADRLPTLLGGRPAPEAPGFVWLAGEQSEVRDCRRHLIGACGVPREHIDFTGYWKRGHAGLPTPE